MNAHRPLTDLTPTLSRIIEQGHIKVQVATIASYIESYGYEMAIQVVEFCLQHITALKKIVEREELDCEFELRRSFDVWLDEEEAKNILQFWQECLVDGQEWMKDYGLIDARYVEQVRSVGIVNITRTELRLDGTGHVDEGSKAGIQHTGMFAVAIQIRHAIARSFDRQKRRQFADQYSSGKR